MDIGEALNTGAYLAFLLREKSGIFDVANSATFEDVRLAVEGRVPVRHYGRMGGMMFSPEDIFKELKNGI